MSVVPNDFEALKRYNLTEIFDPTPKDTAQKESMKATAPGIANSAVPATVVAAEAAEAAVPAE